MPKYRKLTHCAYSCTYHVVWKARSRRLWGPVLNRSGVVRCCGRGAFGTARPCAPGLLDTPEVFSIEDWGHSEGQDGIQIFSKKRHLKEQPYWGEPFLGEGVFCEHCGPWRWNHKRVCRPSGEAWKAGGGRQQELQTLLEFDQNHHFWWWIFYFHWIVFCFIGYQNNFISFFVMYIGSFKKKIEFGKSTIKRAF